MVMAAAGPVDWVFHSKLVCFHSGIIDDHIYFDVPVEEVEGEERDEEGERDAAAETQDLYSLKRRRLISIGIPIINLRRSSDRLRFIMGIPIRVRRRLLSE